MSVIKSTKSNDKKGTAFFSKKTKGFTLPSKKTKGFTLIELVTVISIIGVLVMIAMPNFMDAKRAVSGAEILNNINMAEYNVSMKEVMTETFKYSKK